MRPWEGSRVGTVVRALASHQFGAGSIPAVSNLRVEFVVGSRLAPRVFLLVLRFFPPEKPTFPNSNSIRTENPHENQLGLMWLPF